MASVPTCTASASAYSSADRIVSSTVSVNKRTVVVHQIPNHLTPSKIHNFLSDLHVYGETQRPRFVLDCSNVWVMDGITLDLLLCCLEEVMKSNGDVRLAALHPEAEAVLQIAGVKRLFEVYATVEGAVNSFHQRASSIAMLPFAESSDNTVEHAA
jgi:anti-anti-sigma factor